MGSRSSQLRKVDRNGYTLAVARTPKKLLDIDQRIVDVIALLVEESGLSQREIADQTGMSSNRVGIILRREPPPATVGEVGQIAKVLRTTASAIIARAENDNVTPIRSNVGTPRHTDLETVKLDTAKLAATRDNTPVDPERENK